MSYRGIHKHCDTCTQILEEGQVGRFFSSLTYPSLDQEENLLEKKVKSRRKASSSSSLISSTSSRRTNKFDKNEKKKLDDMNSRPNNTHADNSEIIEKRSNVSLD